MDLEKVFKNNVEWIKSKLEKDSEYFDKLSKGQSPETLYIGCSDSRVTAEEIIGAGPGEIFVHRNIANTVIGTDLNVMSVIEYAVAHLKVGSIVVCGHYGCDGVNAAMQNSDLGILNPWLISIRDVYRIYREDLKSIKDEVFRAKRLVELNVQEQCLNVLKTPVVQKAIRERDVKIYGWVFDLSTGKIIDLKVNVEELLSGICEIYQLD